MKYPIECSIVTNWDDMELVLDHTFSSQLRVDPKEFQVLMAEPPLVPKANREKMTQIMFEKFGVAGFYLQNTSALSMFSAGKQTGVVVESGSSATYTSVVYEGHVLPYTIPKTFYAGSDLDWYLIKLLSSRGYQFSTSAEIQVVKKMKELVCFVSDDFERDMRISETSDKFHKEYELPDGRTVCLNSERFMVGEGLFRPSMFCNDFPGIHKQIKRTITKADPDLHSLICPIIVVTGGNTMFTGLKERLQKELDKNLSGLCSGGPRVIAPPERKMCAWIGGSIMASLNQMNRLWITAQDYEEYGPAQVHTRCF